AHHGAARRAVSHGANPDSTVRSRHSFSKPRAGRQEVNLNPMISILVSMMAFLTVAAPRAATADVAGNWRVEFVVPNGEMGVTMTINQDGAKLTGRVLNAAG